MEDDILHAVFVVEREIQASLAAEKQETDDYLDRVHRECAEMAAEEERQLRDELTAAVDDARNGDARTQAESLLAEASARAERLAGVAGEDLNRLVRREIRTILPGE
jgi:cell division septum initiation protein DivIVA